MDGWRKVGEWILVWFWHCNLSTLWPAEAGESGWVETSMGGPDLKPRKREERNQLLWHSRINEKQNCMVLKPIFHGFCNSHVFLKMHDLKHTRAHPTHTEFLNTKSSFILNTQNNDAGYRHDAHSRIGDRNSHNHLFYTANCLVWSGRP